jgi:hypothetical protein
MLKLFFVKLNPIVLWAMKNLEEGNGRFRGYGDNAVRK